MLEAVAAYAARSGLTVSAAVLDRNGAVLAAAGDDAEEASRKAYTALMYGVATHELRASSKPLWHQPSEIDSKLVLMTPGGYPVVEGVETLGAVGVAGAPPVEAMLCCQAAVETRFSHSPL